MAARGSRITRGVLDSYALHASRPRDKERALSVSEWPTAKSPLKTGALRSAFIYRGRCGGFRGRQSHRVVTTKWPVLLGLKGQEEGMASRTQERVVWRGPS